MTSRDFCFWMQGYLEIGNPQSIGHEELKQIKKHLALVFKHEIDPSMGDQNHQDELNLIHSVPPSPLPSNGYDYDKTILRC
jgi:hypothetical protein